MSVTLVAVVANENRPRAVPVMDCDKSEARDKARELLGFFEDVAEVQIVADSKVAEAAA